MIVYIYYPSKGTIVKSQIKYLKDDGKGNLVGIKESQVEIKNFSLTYDNAKNALISELEKRIDKSKKSILSNRKKLDKWK